MRAGPSPDAAAGTSVETLDPAALEAALLPWYQAAGRTLEVRSAVTPWEILVVEVMSQQTQITRVGPAWRTFVARWPTPAGLAIASTADLLGAWAGLGYNRRALALRAAARRIVTDHRGRVPSELAQLEALPGIGPYTARAIAAAAFGRPVAPLDVNVRRVVGRLVGGATPEADLQAAADRLVSRDVPAAWVHAVMDLAATICTRRSPRCPDCPAAHLCRSRGTSGEASGAGGPRGRFEDSRRWLRGRILARARSAPPGEWLLVRGRFGSHPPTVVRAVLLDLEREGFVERRGDEVRIAVDG